MARRALAALLLAVGLLAASVAWLGLTLQRTLFDAGRSERLASVLLDTEEVERVLVDRTVAALEDALPAAAASEVPGVGLERVARAGLSSPEGSAAVRAALVGTHRYLIGESAEPPSIDTGALTFALRARLIEAQPDLAEVVPDLPAVRVELPTAGLEGVRALRDLVDRMTSVATLVAVVGIAGALLVARDRARVLRRIGWWALVTGGLWVGLRFALPPLARALLPNGAALVSGLTLVVAEGMATPGLLLAAAGGVSLAAGLASATPRLRRRPSRAALGPSSPPWAGAEGGAPPPGRRRSAAAPPPPARRSSASPPGPPAGPRPWSDDRLAAPGTRGPRPPEAPTMRMPAVPGWPGGAQGPGAGPSRPASAGAHRPAVGEPTVPLAASPQATGRPRGPDGPVAPRADAAPPWGYAARPEELPDEGARWVEGVGYVGPAGGGDRAREPGDDA